MRNTFLTQEAISKILRSLAHGAGHDVASVRLQRDFHTDEIEFMLTDARGTIFSGSIPSDWLELTTLDFAGKLSGKYERAFKPFAEIAERAPGATRPLFNAAMGSGEGALDISVDGSNLVRVYRGAWIDQTFDAGHGDTVRVMIQWSKK